MWLPNPKTPQTPFFDSEHSDTAISTSFWISLCRCVCSPFFNML